MRIKPKPYQKKGVRKIDKFKGRALLADEMGLGKTLQALLWLKQNPHARPAIIVCPAVVKFNWEAEALSLVNMRSEVLSGLKPPRQRRMVSPTPLIIINYDILPKWVRFLRRLKPQTIIIDECQYIQNRDALRTKAVRRLCRNIPHVIALSGTPLTNRPAELWPTLNILDKDRWPSFTTFAQRYCEPEWKPWGWQYKGATNIDKLHRILKKRCMIRRLKKDVLGELPPKTREVVLLEIRNRAEYNEAETDFVKWLQKQQRKRRVRSLQAQRLMRMGYLKRLAARLKVGDVKQWLRKFLEETDEKIIVFTIHHKMTDVLMKYFGHVAEKLDGRVTGHKRELAIKSFIAKKKVRILFGNIKAAGVGWNGTVSCNVAFAEIGWTPGEMVQAEDRVWRLGQKRPCTVYYLIARDTVEEKLCETLQKKQEVLAGILDGASQSNKLAIFDQVVRLVQKRALQRFERKARRR